MKWNHIKLAEPNLLKQFSWITHFCWSGKDCFSSNIFLGEGHKIWTISPYHILVTQYTFCRFSTETCWGNAFSQVLNTIFLNGNFIFHVWHCVNNIRMCKEVSWAVSLEVTLLLGCFSLWIIPEFNQSLFFSVEILVIFHTLLKWLLKIWVLYEFPIFIGTAASMLLSDICFCCL